MTVIARGLTVSINGGEPLTCTVEVEQSWIDVSTDIATRPDPGWEHTDPAGHYHAHDKAGDLPTLKPTQVHVLCTGGCAAADDDDETCEGYTVTEYRCALCGAQVQPRYVPDREARSRQMPGRTQWTVTIDGFNGSVPQIGSGPCSVKIEGGARTRFGLAQIVEERVGPDPAGQPGVHHIRIVMVGASPLGERLAA